MGELFLHMWLAKTLLCFIFGGCPMLHFFPYCEQYYDDSLPTVKEQKKFEEMLFKKTRDAAGKLTHEYCLYYEYCYNVAVVK